MRFAKAIVLAVTALTFLLVGYFQGYLHGSTGTLSSIEGIVSDAVHLEDVFRSGLMSRTLNMKKPNVNLFVGLLQVKVESRPFGMHIRRGTVVVEEVFPGFAAEQLGVREGCQILSIAGHKAVEGTWLTAFQKTPMPFNMSFACPPQAQSGYGPLTHDKHNYRVMVVKRPFGMNVQVHTVPRVVEVLPGSAAERAGVRRGFVVKSVNDVPVNAETWASAWQKAEMPFILAFETDVPVKKDNPFINQTSGEWLSVGNGVPIEDLDDEEDKEEFTVTVNELPFGMEVNAPPGRLPTVRSVVNGTAAARAGLRPGDIVLQIAGRYVESSSWFGAFQHAVPPFGLRLRRPAGENELDDEEDDTEDMTVTVSERPFGMNVGRSQMFVEEVFPKFPAQKVGVRKGCLIKEIANKTVSQGTWMEIFKKTKLPFFLKLACPKKGNTKKGSQQRHGSTQSEAGNFTVKVKKRPFGMNIHASVVPRVVEVLPGYPAEAAGVKAGFVLTKIGKVDVDASNWWDIWQHAPLGSVLTFHTNMPRQEDEEYGDDGEDSDEEESKDDIAKQTETELGEGYIDFKCAVKKLPFGMQIVAPKGSRPTVRNVTRGLPAEKEGIKPGDVLVEVAGLPVSHASWFASFQQAVPPFGLRFRRPVPKKPVDSPVPQKREDTIASTPPPTATSKVDQQGVPKLQDANSSTPPPNATSKVDQQGVPKLQDANSSTPLQNTTSKVDRQGLLKRV